MPALPQYTNPPVVETVLGVEFYPLPDWTIGHFGVFWDAVRADFPALEVHPPVVARGGNFSDETSDLSSEDPALYVRCIYLDRDHDRLVQVQKNRFMYNWRKEKGPSYPRYDPTVRPGFVREWERFLSFLASQHIAEPTVRYCEVAYINHFRRGEEWSDLADLHHVLRGWADPESARSRSDESPFLPHPEVIDVSLHYAMRSPGDRLYVELQSARRERDRADVLQLTLTARGRPGGSSTAEIVAWLDTGREWIVRGFTDLTTAEMHRRWGRTA